MHIRLCLAVSFGLKCWPRYKLLFCCFTGRARHQYVHRPSDGRKTGRPVAPAFTEKKNHTLKIPRCPSCRVGELSPVPCPKFLRTQSNILRPCNDPSRIATRAMKLLWQNRCSVSSIVHKYEFPTQHLELSACFML